MGNMYGIPVQTVAGNCDFLVQQRKPKLFEIAGHTILIGAWAPPACEKRLEGVVRGGLCQWRRYVFFATRIAMKSNGAEIWYLSIPEAPASRG